MVKKKSGGSKLRKRKDKPPQSHDQQQDAALQHSDMAEASQDPPQRLQRKIAKRVNFLDNVAKSHKLALLPRIKKKQKRRKGTGAALGDLSSIADALGVAEKDVTRQHQRQMKGLGVGGAKARRKLASKETVRLQKVLAHPQFQGNPIAAVAQHLSAVFPPGEAPKTARKNVSGSQKEKARRQKARMESEMES